MKNRLVYGWGINDVEGNVCETKYENGKLISRKECIYYKKWSGVIQRAKSELFILNNPSYIGTTVCDEWKYFSNFKAWVDSQPNKNWRNCHLDKDVLVEGNKHYSPDTCAFVTPKCNFFVKNIENPRGEYLSGVTFHRATRRFAATCTNPLANPENPKEKVMCLGYYSTEIEAYLSWRDAKCEIAAKLAELEEDPRVRFALNQRYKKLSFQDILQLNLVDDILAESFKSIYVSAITYKHECNPYTVADFSYKLSTGDKIGANLVWTTKLRDRLYSCGTHMFILETVDRYLQGRL